MAGILRVLLARRLEDRVLDGAFSAVAVGESIIIMTAYLRSAPAERGSTWFGILENAKGLILSVGTCSIVETDREVGNSFVFQAGNR